MFVYSFVRSFVCSFALVRLLVGSIIMVGSLVDWFVILLVELVGWMFDWLVV